MAYSFSEQRHLDRYEKSVREILTSATKGLFEWQNPDLPDDLHLMRADGSTWMACVAHPESAWLELTQSELEQLKNSALDLAATLRSHQGNC